MGVLFKNSDSSDEPAQTWLDGDKFYSTAQKILSALQQMVMRYGMSKDAWLKNYLSLDPLNKAQWCADHLVKFAEAGHI